MVKVVNVISDIRIKFGKNAGERRDAHKHYINEFKTRYPTPQLYREMIMGIKRSREESRLRAVQNRVARNPLGYWHNKLLNEIRKSD